MAKYLEQIDIFTIWGDTTESWSKVATEAMMSGIPVVARDHKDGLSEQLTASGGGFLVTSEAEFIETVQTLIDSPRLRTQIGGRGRVWALRHAS
ncbi:glycosyltransferase, partial [candidate division KSB1 bacterium]|nr:glycosyltransferase [candidate division KSB1 bacterium]